jgi:hypothetical protein
MSLRGYEKLHADFLKENHPSRYRALVASGELEKVCKKQARRARRYLDENKGSVGVINAEDAALQMFITPDLTISG